MGPGQFPELVEHWATVLLQESVQMCIDKPEHPASKYFMANSTYRCVLEHHPPTAVQRYSAMLCGMLFRVTMAWLLCRYCLLEHRDFRACNQPLHPASFSSPFWNMLTSRRW